MSSNTREVFGGKSFADLLEDIYNNSAKKRKQIEILVNELRPLINNTNEAAVIVPLIKDYLEVGVRNDEQLVKMAGVFQKYMASEDRVNSIDNPNSSGILTQQEKEDLLNEVAKEIVEKENMQESDFEIDKEFDDLLTKTDKVKTEVSGSGVK